MYLLRRDSNFLTLRLTFTIVVLSLPVVSLKAQVCVYFCSLIKILFLCTLYRDIQVKLENCKWLYQTENMDRFLIEWYFYYHKGGEFCMVIQKFRKNSLQMLKISVKARFPILKLPFSFNFIYCMF